jgi:hypothetical protein
MRIRKCDRCGKVYEPYDDVHNTITVSTYDMNNECVDNGESYDLCPDCKEEFRGWLHRYQTQGSSPLSKAILGHM